MDKNKESIDSIVGDYKYGFTTDAKTVLTSGKGLNREVVEFISKAKNEPDWMLEFRLEAYESFLKQKNPSWGPDLSSVTFDEYTYYIKSTEKTENDWDNVPTEIKDTFDKLVKGVSDAVEFFNMF